MIKISDSESKKYLVKLQKVVIDGLQDVKAQGILAFDTTDLSPLFERVIIASATSSRQTKALAQSVRDKVTEAGFDKPRVEGDENGEWIIVDCGAAVVHIMQPAVREYYRLEEIWGDKPVALSKGHKKAESAAKKTERKSKSNKDESKGEEKRKSKKTAAKPEAAIVDGQKEKISLKASRTLKTDTKPKNAKNVQKKAKSSDKKEKSSSSVKIGKEK